MQDKLTSFGVVGGMGPASTTLFLQKIVTHYKKTLNARNDYDFPQMTLFTVSNADYHDGAIDPNLFKQLTKAFEIFNQAESAFVVAPCNTVHHYLLGPQFDLSIPLIKITSAVEKVYQKDVEGSNVLFLSNSLTVKSNIYANFLRHADVTYLNQADQYVLDEVLLNVNFGALDDTDFITLRGIIEKYDVDSILLGCTELGLLDYSSLDLKIIDSLSALAQITFNVSAGIESIEDYQTAI